MFEVYGGGDFLDSTSTIELNWIGWIKIGKKKGFCNWIEWASFFFVDVVFVVVTSVWIVRVKSEVGGTTSICICICVCECVLRLPICITFCSIDCILPFNYSENLSSIAMLMLPTFLLPHAHIQLTMTATDVSNIIVVIIHLIPKSHQVNGHSLVNFSKTVLLLLLLLFKLLLLLLLLKATTGNYPWLFKKIL